MSVLWVVAAAHSNHELLSEQIRCLKAAASMIPERWVQLAVCCGQSKTPAWLQDVDGIRLVQTDASRGPNAARDKAIRFSPAKATIVELDDNALIEPGALRWIHRALCVGTELATGDCLIADSLDEPAGSERRLHKNCYWPFSVHERDTYHVGIRAFRRGLYDRVGGYRLDELPVGEYALMLRMEAELMGKRISTIPRALCRLVGRPGQRVHDEVSSAMVFYRRRIPPGYQKYFACRRNTSDDQIFAGCVIENEYRLPRRFHGHELVIDIGLHIGAFAYACLVRGAGHVHGFEALQDNVALAKYNLRWFDNCTLHHRAIWRSDVPASTLTVTQATSPIGGSQNMGGCTVVLDSDAGEQVESVSLDSVIDSILRHHQRDTIDLIKLDCESSEFPILLTSRRLACVRTIIGEFHGFRTAQEIPERARVGGFPLYTGEALAEFLRQQGFDVGCVDTHEPGMLGLFFASR